MRVLFLRFIPLKSNTVMKSIVTKISLLSFLISISFSSFADEGMWIPSLIKKINIEDMQANGLKLTAEQIYSVNQSSLKDGIVHFGGGCTGEMISSEGLLLTNHHCGYRYIQTHSSVDNDYLKDGFWAMSRNEELACKGLTATFIVSIKDVTARVLAEVNDDMTEDERFKKIDEISTKLEDDAKAGTHYDAVIKPFYYGNEYYLIMTETFTDVRMVGAPPSSIGKFGADTDNWIWPRHTGDFSLFRVYAGPDNKPAKYSEDNVPFKPRHHFPISLDGYKKGDFTMVYGFPGRTFEYLSSHGVKTIYEQTNPHSIKARDVRMEAMVSGMKESDKVRIQYASKQSGVSNAWKKWKGQNRGLRKLDAIAQKQEFEKKFSRWVAEDPKRSTKYGDILPSFERIYNEQKPYELARTYINEAIFGIEILRFAWRFQKLVSHSQNEQIKDAAIAREADGLAKRTKRHFKDYHPPIDKKVCAELLKLYVNNVDAKYRCQVLNDIETKFNGNFNAYTTMLFSRSLFANEDRISALLSSYNRKKVKKIVNDPAFALVSDVIKHYRRDIASQSKKSNDELDVLYRKYMQAIREMSKDPVYPDANSTLRISYGKVDDYDPRNGVHYDYMTTLEGVIQKAVPGDWEFDVPEKLIELYKNKDYGPYGIDGQMPVCFIASNHTTGGNSGSPVINADGHLIGTNFDRNWEGTMSDIMYDPDQVRNISLDVRYTLFIIDKFAGAKHLIDELTIVEKKVEEPAEEPAKELEVEGTK